MKAQSSYLLLLTKTEEGKVFNLRITSAYIIYMAGVGGVKDMRAEPHWKKGGLNVPWAGTSGKVLTRATFIRS